MIRGWSQLKPPIPVVGNFSAKVSVLIAARNEEEGIHRTIDAILAQDYPPHLFELIIADDHSTDRTAEIIKSYAHRGVRLLQLTDEKVLNSYKKRAIAEAIKLSTGDLIVATDADCLMGTKWLSAIVGYYEANNMVMISSPVTYFEERNLFERMQTLEFSYLIGIGASFIGNNRASNCNGANLAYSKAVFYEVGGFAGIDDLASGDDELLLQKIAVLYPHRIGFLKHTDAVVYTHAKHTLNELMVQRRRWASKSVKYKNKWVVAFGVSIWLFNVSILANAVLSLFIPGYWVVLALQFLFKHVFETIYLYPINVFFGRPKLVALLLLLSPVHVLYFVYVGLSGNSKQYIWKGRLVR